ncbi:hypothetical protein GCM10022243_29580 [Saccharothrix violaceirubra]|uniref:Winged helix DNA-binding protein n=1 Tax=Saccharothrix violaceirubra TaxID=413306 RepID=A0A7W7T5Y4_9PSEU|nr:hypothetical protein [Saccharothrix violaceirubra]MBB4966582.1 hypothetical protein [Saccharothrix violaceirubra]
MSDDRLTAQERATLLVLLAEARELTNADLRAVAGLSLDGASRRRLNDLDLVTSTKVGRAYVHELTDRGAVRCAEEFGAERPARSGYASATLYAVLAGLRRWLDDTDHAVADLFRPDLARRVLDAHRAVTGAHGPVRLADLRDRLADVPRADLDRVLDALARRAGVHLWAEADQKTLTDRDRDAALVLGGSARHVLVVGEAG